MKSEYLIAVNEFCAKHGIEVSFIVQLQQTGLIELITIDEQNYVEVNQLPHLEKIIRFYYEMDINLEGIETINHLLIRMQSLQNKVTALNNRLRFYEIDD